MHELVAFCGLFYDTQCRGSYRRPVGWAVKDRLERICKDVVVA
jgi:hypothetical protein